MIRIGNIIIRSARSVRRVLEDHYIERKYKPVPFNILMGAYLSRRWYGLCIYRGPKSELKTMARLEKWFQEDLARADALIEKYKDCLDVTDEDRKQFKEMMANIEKEHA